MNYFKTYENLKALKNKVPVESIWEFAKTNDKLRVTGHQVIHSSVIDPELFVHYQTIESNGRISHTSTCVASGLIHSAWKMIT